MVKTDLKSAVSGAFGLITRVPKIIGNIMDALEIPKISAVDIIHNSVVKGESEIQFRLFFHARLCVLQAELGDIFQRVNVVLLKEVQLFPVGRCKCNQSRNAVNRRQNPRFKHNIRI